MSEVREREVRVGGLRTVLAEAGPPDADEAVVFVHGNPGSALDWHDLMGRTGEFARAVALDMPGFGRADKPRDFPVPLAGHAAFLGAALDDLGVKRAHLVLHDFGGPWGLGWAGAHQDAFASVVLMNTGFLIGFEPHDMARRWQKPVVGELVMALTNRAAWRKAFAKGDARPLPRAYVDQMYDHYDRGTRRTVLRLYRAPRITPEAMTAIAEAFAPLDRPALILWGGKDPYVPVRHAEQQLIAFPGARVEILPDSGHWPFADDPEGVAAQVLPFLRGQTPGETAR